MSILAFDFSTSNAGMSFEINGEYKSTSFSSKGAEANPKCSHCVVGHVKSASKVCAVDRTQYIIKQYFEYMDALGLSYFDFDDVVFEELLNIRNKKSAITSALCQGLFRQAIGYPSVVTMTPSQWRSKLGYTGIKGRDNQKAEALIRYEKMTGIKTKDDDLAESFLILKAFEIMKKEEK